MKKDYDKNIIDSIIILFFKSMTINLINVKLVVFCFSKILLNWLPFSGKTFFISQK